VVYSLETSALRVRTGPGKPGKPWKRATGAGKFRKSVKIKFKKNMQRINIEILEVKGLK